MTAKYEQFRVVDRISSGGGEDAWWLSVGLVFSFAAALGIAIGVLGGPLVAILSAILAAAVVTLMNYRVGIWFMIILLPFSHTVLIPRQMFGITGLNPLNAIVAGTILSLVLTSILRPKDFTLPHFRSLWLLYVLPISLAALHGVFYCHEIPAFFGRADTAITNGVSGYLQEMLFKPAIIVLVAIITAIGVRNASGVHNWLMVPVFVAATLVALIIPFYALTPGLGALTSFVVKSKEFASAVGAHANEIGFLLNTAFALALFTWMGTRQGVVKSLLAGVIVIVSIAVAWTFSRGAYIGWMIVVAYFLVTRRKMAWLFGTVAAMLVVVAIIPPEVVERAYFGIQGGDLNRISSGRVYDIWLPLLPTLLESPFYGHGLRSILWAEPMRRGAMMTVGHTHSAYLGLLLDLGIVGAVLVWMFWFRLWQAFRALCNEHKNPAWRGYFEGASVCILILLVQGLTEDQFTPTAPQSFIWVSAGIAYGMLGRTSTPVPGSPAGK